MSVFTVTLAERGKLAAVVDGGDPALGVDRPHFAVGDEGDVPLRERCEQRPRSLG